PVRAAAVRTHAADRSRRGWTRSGARVFGVKGAVIRRCGRAGVGALWWRLRRAPGSRAGAAGARHRPWRAPLRPGHEHAIRARELTTQPGRGAVLRLVPGAGRAGRDPGMALA